MAKKKPNQWNAADGLTLDDLERIGYQHTTPLEPTPAASQDEPKAGFMRRMADVALSAGAKGVIGVGEAAVGGADLMTGGHAGKFLEDTIGYRPKEAREFIDTQLMSDASQAEQRKFQQAEGVLDKTMVALKNPWMIANAASESAPSMVGGAGVGRGLLKVAPRLGRIIAAAIGEGAVGAGQSAEQIRQQSADGTLSTKQTLSALGSGAGTALLGALGGKVAKTLGIGDVDTMLVKGSLDAGVRKNIVRATLEGAVSEGLLEELPQSIQEQVWQNYATNRPLSEGVDDAAVMGALTGGLMGGGANVVSRKSHEKAAPIPELLPEHGPLSRAVNTGIKATAATMAAQGIQPVGITPEQEAAAMGAMEQLASDDMKAIKDAGRADKTGLGGMQSTQGTQDNQPEMATATVTPDQPWGDRLLTIRDQFGDESVRQRVRDQFGDQALGDAMYYAQAADNPEIPEKTRERMLSLAERVIAAAHIQPIETGSVDGPATGGQAALPTQQQPAQIGMDTRPTGTMLADEQGNVRGETRVEKVSREQEARRKADIGLTPDVEAAQARMVRPGDITRPNGEPFKNRAAANIVQKKQGGAVVEVVGGFVVRQDTSATPTATMGTKMDVKAGPGTTAADVMQRFHPDETHQFQRTETANDQNQTAPVSGAKTESQAQQEAAAPAEADRTGRAAGLSSESAGGDTAQAAGMTAPVRLFGSTGYQLTMADAVKKVAELEKDAREAKKRANVATTKVIQKIEDDASARAASLARQLRNDIKALTDGYPDARQELEVAKQAKSDSDGIHHKGQDAGLKNAKPSLTPALDAALRSVGIDPNAPRDKNADKAKVLRTRADKLHAEARSMLNGIPPGQPIHSSRDANLRERAREKSNKAAELHKQADALEADKQSEQTARNAPKRVKEAKPSASWAIKNKETGEVIAETFDRKKVEALNTTKYEATPIAEHLGSLNTSANETSQPIKGAKDGQQVQGQAPAKEVRASAADKVIGEKIDDEWTAFSKESGTLGIPRDEMPQIKAEHRGALVNFLNALGIEHAQEEAAPATLKPTQAEFSPAKVEQAKAFTGGDRSILASEDSHVLDGHHQWLAKLETGEPVKLIRLKAPIRALLEQVKQFPSAEQDQASSQATDQLGDEPGEQANPFSAFDAVAKEYGYTVTADGLIGKGDKFPGPRIVLKGGRLRIEGGSGQLLASYAGQKPISVGKFLESFWYAEKKAPVAENSATGEILGAAAGESRSAPAGNDRDTFTLERQNKETGRMESVKFERGEYVKVWINNSSADFGEIDGISQAKREFSVNGLWHTMGAAYKAERPATPVKKTEPLSKTIEKMNAKNGEGLTDADRVPEQSPASKTPTLDKHTAVIKAVRSGTASVEDYQSAFDAMVGDPESVKAEMNTLTKESMLRAGGAYFYQRYKSETKADVIKAMYDMLVNEYALGKEYGPTGYMMGARKGYDEAKAKALRDLVEGQTAETLADFAAEVKAAQDEDKAEQEAKEKALENPQSLNDFRALIRKHVMEGKTRKEAFLMLTPEQRIKYDELEAEGTKEAREARKRAQKTEVRAAGQTTGGEIVATKHTRDGYDLFVVKLADRLSREDYTTVLASAKKLGGWYSAFRGNGAIPGFQFKDKANAEAFLKLAGGDTSDAQAQAEQRRDAFEDDRSQTVVERLRAMADKLDGQASEIENADRKTNTERRARFAERALNGAAEMKAKAATMRNIAQSIEQGNAKFLDSVRTKSQVDMLTGIVATAKNKELRAKYQNYADQERRRLEPATAETADFAEFPTFTAYRSDLASLARRMLEVEGTKKLGQQLMKVADDVTGAYLDFAKDPANLHKLSTFSMRRGDEVKAAIFASRDLAERAINRSGLTGKAIVLAEKRGVNRIIMSPSEAINAGIWTGDGDKLITLTADSGNALVGAIGRRGNKSNNLSVPWQFQNAHDELKALARIGIETPSELRSALREFIGLQERSIANKVREMELKMVGRKADGLDFFPTPDDVADQMVEAAELTPEMAVLEPSAGMGHIADKIRAAGAEPDVIEMSGDRRELLYEKGYNLADVNDFLDLKPREFFTYGDVFRAPDGTEGVLRGQGGMGSNRVRLVSEDGRELGKFDRDELVGVRHRGVDSGYDRIIMNPPFSNRRDAEHVRHAYDLLKPGGRIVAIMGEGVFFGKDKKAQDFRDWLESVGGTDEKLPSGSFNDPSLPVNTGANARMVVIDKPESTTKFKRSTQATYGDEVSSVKSIVSEITSKWQNAPDVVVIGSMSDAPESVQRDNDKALAMGADRNPSAFYSGGKVYLIASEMNGPQHVVETLLHEVLGHHGLQGAFGDSLKPMLQQLWVTRRRAVEDKCIEYGLDTNSKADRLIAAEEVLADMAQTDPRIGFVRRAVAAIRAWLRQHVPGFSKMSVTDDEIVSKYLIPARNWVERGGAAASNAGRGVHYARNVAKESIPWYSELERQVETVKLGTMPPGQWKAWLGGLPQKGVKPDEIAWSGIREWLDLQQGKISKDQVLEYLRGNGVKVTETVLGNSFSFISTDGYAKRFDSESAAQKALDEEKAWVENESVTVDDKTDDETNPYITVHDHEGNLLFWAEADADGEWSGTNHYGDDVYLSDEYDARDHAEEVANGVREAWLQEMSIDIEPDEKGGHKYSQYTLPGGENYRELLLTLPDDGSKARATALRKIANTRGMTDAERDELIAIEAKKYFESSHWDQSNVLAHIRFNERTDAEGKRVLFIEEIQSDWAQQGKKDGFASAFKLPEGYKTVQANGQWELRDSNNDPVGAGETAEDAIRDYRSLMNDGPNGTLGSVPVAPFVTNTDAWVALSIKRATKWAIDNGFDRVAFTTGEQSAERYDLSKQISKVRYEDNSTDGIGRADMGGAPGRGILYAYDHEGNLKIERWLDDPIKELPDLIGKELAEKLLNAESTERRSSAGFGVRQKELSGLDIKVGGEGMRAFYDKIVPSVAKDVLKKLGGGQLISVPISQATGSEVRYQVRLDDGSLLLGEDGGIAYYPNNMAAAKKARFFGGKAERVNRPVAAVDQPGFDITPAMREKASNGMPLFSVDESQASMQTGEYGEATKAHQRYAEKLRALISAGGTDVGVLHAVAPRAGSADGSGRTIAAVATAAKRIFDKEVVFVKFAGKPLFNGAMSDKIPGVVFIRVDSSKPMMAVLGHELLHHLRRDLPGIYQTLENRIKTVLKGQNQYAAQLAAKYAAIGKGLPHNWLEELHADIVGDNFTDPEFWKAVAKDQPGLFRRVVNAITKFLDDVADKIGSLRPFGTDTFLKDVAAARSAVADAMRQYSGTQVGSMAGSEDGIKLSIADALGSINQQSIRDNLADFMGSAGAKVSWWEKSIGTQYAKAERHPEFKPVFDAVQQYVEDTSSLANGAADHAPNLLPKLDTWKDLTKGALSKADTTAIAAPIFEGTLIEQRVFDDDELRSRYKLNERQIGLYKEFRETVNDSLDQVVAADVLRLLGDVPQGFKSLAVRNRGALQGMVDQFLADQMEKTEDDGRREELQKLKAAIDEKYARAQELKDHGYAPLMRFGKFLVNVRDNQTGESLFFGLYENRMAANRMARMLAEDPEFKARGTIQQGVLSQEQHKLFAGVPLESMEMFAQAIGADQSEVFQQYLKLVKNNRSAMKRLIKRNGTAGFSQDVQRVLAAFVTSNARLTSGGLNMPQASKAAQEIKSGDVKDEAVKLIDTVQNPTETASAARSLLFMNFIGGSAASAIVNLTQPITMTAPYLSQWGGMRKAGARLIAAAKDAATGRVAEPELAKALKRAEDDGIVSPQEIHHLQAEAMGSWGTHPLMKKAAFIWGSMFSLAEQFNRRVTFIAAYRTAKEQGIGNPFEFAEKAVVETQGLYNAGNRANWARNPVGATVLTFKQFSTHYIEWFMRMWRSGPEGKKAAIYALAILMLAAGADGLPFSDDLDDFIDTLAQAMGYDFSAKRAKQKFVAETLGLGDDAAEVFTRGLSSVPGIPIDVSMRMSMGNLIPATGLFLKSNTDRSRDVMEVGGAAGALAKQYIDVGEKLLQGDLLGAGKVAMPVALQSAVKGIDIWQTGEYRDTKDRRVMDADTLDGLMKFVGFQPAEIAAESRKIGLEQRRIGLAKAVEAEIADQWAKGMMENDQDMIQAARDRLMQWNSDNPRTPIAIGRAQLIRRVREMKAGRTERFIKTAPKEIRGSVAEAIN